MASIPEGSEAGGATRIFGRFLASIREGTIGNAWGAACSLPDGVGRRRRAGRAPGRRVHG